MYKCIFNIKKIIFLPKKIEAFMFSTYLLMLNYSNVYANSTGTAGGTDIFTKASELMLKLYGEIVKISTVTAVVTTSITLILMNFSKSSRTVDESRAWLKRIVVTWLILNLLGFIVAFLKPLIEGGNFTG